MLAAALAIEPGNAAAHAWWAYWHLLLVGQGWATDPVAATQRAGELAERAVTLDPGDARALALVGHVRGFLYKRARGGLCPARTSAFAESEPAVGVVLLGRRQQLPGPHEEAIERIAQAQRLSPHDPHAFFFDMALMMPHLLRGEFDNGRDAGAAGDRA